MRNRVQAGEHPQLPPAKAIPTQAIKTNRHPSASWKRFSTAEWLVIHLDLALPFCSSATGKSVSRFARVTFFACAKKVTKETHPNGAPHDEAVGSASRPGISVSHILWLRKRRTSMCAAPAGFTRPACRASRGLTSKSKEKQSKTKPSVRHPREGGDPATLLLIDAHAHLPAAKECAKKTPRSRGFLRRFGKPEPIASSN